MLRAQMSIMGLYHYNNTIFDNFDVPDGVDKDNVILEILSQCAELELVYPSWDIMYTLIGAWTKSELYQWERAYNVITAEYNPIWNVDAHEEESITRELSGATSDSMEGETSSTNTTDTETINSTKGYNSNSWTETDKTDGSATDTGTGTQSESRTGTNTESETITNVRDRGGNIGITMSQQLVTAELDLLQRLNITQYIVDSFKRRFCLLVY